MEQKLLDALQEQVNVERQNAAFYKSMSIALEAARWPGCAAWMAKAASEEQDHSDLIARHIIDRTMPGDDTRPVYSALEAPETPEGDLLVDFFHAALDAEQENTLRLSELQLLAESLRDRQTYVFLNPLIDEQTTSEGELSDKITELIRAGDDVAALLVLDERYGDEAKG